MKTHPTNRTTVFRRALLISLIIHGLLTALFTVYRFSTPRKETVWEVIPLVELPPEPAEPEPQEEPSPPHLPEPVSEPPSPPQQNIEPEPAISPEQPRNAKPAVELPPAADIKPAESGEQLPPDYFLLKSAQPGETLPPAEVHDTVEISDTTDTPDTTVKRGPVYSFDTTRHYGEKPEKNKPPMINPIELMIRKLQGNPEDERRNFSGKFLGLPIPLGGPVGLVLLTAQHATKRLFWAGKDRLKKRKTEEIREQQYIMLDERGLRFLIVLWRDGLVYPERLSHTDRVFLWEGVPSGEPLMTNRAYLESMEEQGLVTSLKKGGIIRFRSNITRDEVLHTLSITMPTAVSETEQETFLRYIELIDRCYDFRKQRVVIPR
ncbi:hypothetical protein LLG96_17785 [bacterium]|nr:hypothetical protein [bacterium]